MHKTPTQNGSEGGQGECSWTVEDMLAVELRELYLSDKLLNTVHTPSGK